MIVPMKKFTVISLAHHGDETVNRLQDLGLLHVQRVPKPETNMADGVADKLHAVRTALRILEEAAGPSHEPAAKDATPDEVVGKVLSLTEKNAQRRDTLNQLNEEIEKLRVWGEFNPTRIADLATHGVFVKLYSCMPEQVPLLPEGCVLHEIDRDKKAVAFALVGREDVALDIPPVQLPDAPPSELSAQAAELEKEIKNTEIEVTACASQINALEKHEQELEDDHARAVARDQLASAGTLTYLQGFAPAEDTDKFVEAAKQHGWGLIVDDPAPEDHDTPTLIRNPRWLRPVETVFDFIDTFPGYRERDISMVFYLFFSVFYAMLIGDAGYGAVFLIATICIHIWKGKKIPKQALFLMYVLNITTIVWGIITASYFGITLPEHALVKKAMLLDTSSFNETVFLCFILALAQLVIAHVWNAVRFINSWQAIAEVGKVGIVIAMYFLANTLILKKHFPDIMVYVGIISVVLAFVFSCIGKRSSDLVAVVFQFPFSVINTFGDMASYIRLFAVGFASMATAQAFNELAMRVGMNNIATGFLAALILILGHSLNMAMGLLAVMVHGLRLNLLEFSSHLGQEWSGAKYNPLKRGE